MWQEIVFSVGSIIFTLALIPTILSENKPPVSTAVMTGSILYTYVIAFATLDLYYSAITTLVTAISWTIIAFRR